MTDLVDRREADRLLSSLDKRVALIDQAQTLGAKTAEANHKALERQLEAVASEVRAGLIVQNAAAADLNATPVGRLVLNALAERAATDKEHADRLDELEGWVDGFKGSLTTMRALVIVLGGISSLLAIAATVISLTHGTPVPVTLP